jgi:DNA topoisomerase-2
VNAGSNKQRDDSTTEIRLKINRKDDMIDIYNNGKGLPISNHPIESKPIPSIMFGQFMTSNNDKKHENSLFEQTWRNNMQVEEKVI